MEALTFKDIFVGESWVVLLSSMFFALAANLFRKRQRYMSRKPDSLPWNAGIWIIENGSDMVAGFFVTYVSVLLIPVISASVFEAIGMKLPESAAHSIIIVAVFIGYHVDSITKKIQPKI